MEGAVPRASLWTHSVPRVELDHRSREASLRLEQIERLLNPHSPDDVAILSALDVILI